MKEGLLAVAGRGRGGGFFLPGVELECTEDGVGQFEGRGEVALHAAVERIAEHRVRPRGDFVPHESIHRNQHVPGVVPQKLSTPEVDFVTATGPGQAETLPVPRRDGRENIAVTGVAESRAEAGRHERSGHGVDRGRDGFERATLGGGAGEAFIPVGQSRQGSTGSARGVDVWKIDLGLDAFVADPVSEAALGAETCAGASGRARHRHGGEVDGSVELLDDGRGRRGRPLNGARRWLAGDRG